PDIPDVLADYMGSLRRLIEMGIGLTYPAHGTLIARGDERAHQILLHHDRRLLDMAELVRAGDSSAFDVMLRSFRSDLNALRRLIEMGSGRTCRAHGTHMERGADRAHQILLHHDRRLLDMAELERAGASSPFDVMLRSFRSDLHALQIRLAMLETIAQLEHL